MYVVGGAAIALAFDERRSTRDVDASFEPKREIYDAAAEIADELGLRRSSRPGSPLLRRRIVRRNVAISAPARRDTA